MFLALLLAYTSCQAQPLSLQRAKPPDTVSLQRARSPSHPELAEPASQQTQTLIRTRPDEKRTGAAACRERFLRCCWDSARGRAVRMLGVFDPLTGHQWQRTWSLRNQGSRRAARTPFPLPQSHSPEHLFAPLKVGEWIVKTMSQKYDDSGAVMAADLVQEFRYHAVDGPALLRLQPVCGVWDYGPGNPCSKPLTPNRQYHTHTTPYTIVTPFGLWPVSCCRHSAPFACSYVVPALHLAPRAGSVFAPPCPSCTPLPCPA